MYDEQRSRSFRQEVQLQGFKEEKEKLEKDLAFSSERFADTVSEIESAKERERSLYEESIVRLLNNLDKKDSFSILLQKMMKLMSFLNDSGKQRPSS